MRRCSFGSAVWPVKAAGLAHAGQSGQVDADGAAHLNEHHQDAAAGPAAHDGAGSPPVDDQLGLLAPHVAQALRRSSPCRKTSIGKPPMALPSGAPISVLQSPRTARSSPPPTGSRAPPARPRRSRETGRPAENSAYDVTRCRVSGQDADGHHCSGIRISSRRSVKGGEDERDSDLIRGSDLTGWVRESSGGHEAMAAA